MKSSFHTLNTGIKGLYIKRVYREEDGLRLVSINPKYKDIHISYEEDPRIVGIIVGNFVPMEG